MRKLHLLSTVVLAIFWAGISFAQDFSNKGKDFWVAYGYHQVMTGGNAQNMVLYFATEAVTTVTVSIPALGYTQTYPNIPANTVFTSAPIPKTGLQDARLTAASTAPEDKGIHITSTKPIIAYSHIYNSNVSGASILFPTPTLGKEYYSVNYTNISNNPNSNCWFYVIATDPGTTTVEITPSANAVGHVAGVPFLVNLTQGQVYNVMGEFNNASNPQKGSDLTGSLIKSINIGTGCKRIAVFSGSGRISITCNGADASSDNYMVQAFPKSAWGKKYLTTPTSGSQNNNIYRICLQDPATVVTLNGNPIGLPLQNNFYYELPASSSYYRIEADKPIMVSQYTTSQGACGNGTPGDPEVIYLSPVEQNINKVLWYATPNFNISQHFYNVVIPNSGTAISSFRVDNISVPASSFLPHPQDPGFVYLRQSVAGGSQHIIQSDSGFNAIAYGFGNFESYGYNAGTNIRDIFQFVTVQNEYGTVDFPSTCRNTPFFFSMTFPYQPTSILWEFNGLFSDFNMPDPSVYFVGTLVVSGRTLYRYKIPTPYSIPNAGTYPIKVVAANPTPDGCGGIQEIDYDIQVFNNPVAQINANPVCFPNPVQFTDNSNTDGRPIIQRYLNYGDNNSTGTLNPSHAYATPGVYPIKYTLITDIGCLADTAFSSITVSPLPTASIASSVTEVCQNGTEPVVTFTGAVGTAPYTFTYKINNGPDQTITTTSGNSISINISTATPGTYEYKLVSVSDASPATCSQLQSGVQTIVVNPLPTATIAGNITVCKNAPSPNITFTGAVGAAPYTFTYNINSGPDLTVTTTSGNSVTVTAPTNTPGTYTYTLKSVLDASNTLCSNLQSGSVTVNVNDLPTASIGGTTEVCLNGTPPLVTFTGANTTAPYTFSYNINGGATQTVTTSASNNSVTVPVPTGTAGTYTYNLLEVTDGTANACKQLQTGAATVIVNSLPTAEFNLPATTCETESLTFTDASVANSGNVTNWSWNFGDPASGPANTSNATNGLHTYNTPGPYTVTLTVTTDKGCVSNPVRTKNITVNHKPVTVLGLPEVCLSDTYAQFTDQSTIPTGIINQWLWNFGDPPSGPLNTSTQQNPQHSYAAVGNYTVTLTATSDKGCATTKSESFTVNGDIPVANFNPLNPTTLCANAAISIQDASTVNFGSVTKVEIYWDNGSSPTVFETDDNPTPGKIYTHLYPDFQSPLTKTFTIRYRAYSGGTCVSDRFKTVTVNASPKVQFVAMPDVCLDASSYQITQGTEIGGVPGTGVYTGPGVNATGLFNTYAAGPPGNAYTITYTYTSAAGGCVDSKTSTIKILDSATARFTTISPLVCERRDISFSASSSSIPPGNGNITGWNWDFADAVSGPLNTSTIQNPVHKFVGWGPYDVKLNVLTDKGCKSTTLTQRVYVNPLARPKFEVPPSSCLPSASVPFTNRSTIPDGSEGSFNYVWDFDDPTSGTLNSSTNSSPTHIYNTVGPFNVKLQVTSGAGCVHDTTIAINTIHPQPTAAIRVDKNDVCVGQSFNFSDNSNPADGTTVQWNWDLGDRTLRSNPSFTYTYANAGDYSVTLTIINSFGCKSTLDTKPVTVNPYPVVNAGPDLFILEGGSDTLQPIVNAINPTFLWTDNRGDRYFQGSNTIKNAIIKGVEDVFVTLIVTGRGGCKNSDQVFIKVLKGPEIPNIFSPNGDGIHDRWEIKYLDTYPEGTVEIFNRYGQRIFYSKGYGKPWDGTINGKQVPIGTYYYIVSPKNGRPVMSGYVDIIR
jgi:gliding motility-associated-like protein